VYKHGGECWKLLETKGCGVDVVVIDCAIEYCGEDWLHFS
jgi:hypothetical protein